MATAVKHSDRIASLAKELDSRLDQTLMVPCPEGWRWNDVAEIIDTVFAGFAMHHELSAAETEALRRAIRDRHVVYDLALVEPPGRQEQRERRMAVIEPLLKPKGWSLERWANVAGVNVKSAQRYASGKTYPRVEQRKKLAEAIGLRELPE